MLGSTVALTAEDSLRPNVLWITSEDNGPHLGCYGDDYATTPNLDALAARGMIYRTCWSNAPVCAPARTTIISGMYPTSLGAEHMRSMTQLPDAFKMYPVYLREAGYYCTNNSKEDYNVKPTGEVWDDSSGKAHWKKRADGQPFFAIFNHTISHESKLRTRPHKAVHDAAKVRVPGYHPDTPEVRQDWAQYYDRITEMDALAGENLQEIAAAGLADDTIVFYYGDHGSGMPRSKRWPYNSGLQVPLIVYIPEKFKDLRPDDYVAGGSTDRLVSFVDLAPTLLSLCGIEPPAHMQGFAFAGKFTAPQQDYVYGYRGRMDERYDMVRSVGDGRYVYIRNYMPHKIYGQYIDYMFQTPTTRIWKEMFDAGKLNEAQSRFWKTKPAEELYDLKSDPDEVNNLANSLQHQEILQRMRKAQQDLAIKIRDIGFLPEGEIHTRSAGSTPYEMAHDNAKYPLAKIMAAAEQASSLKTDALDALMTAFTDEDSAVRYWAAMGLLMRGEAGVSLGRDQLRKALGDESPHVRIAAAEALGRYGNKEDITAALSVLLTLASPVDNGIYTSMSALNAIDYLDANAAPIADMVAELPDEDPNANGRMSAYAKNLIDKTLSDLK
ncbi:MAG: sulfatase-like hydrolase/transferase [Planctomycetaceae bacterium]|nr:sulfatase-like hydrolase/transferase [Planctomycetaceae bacterium]MCB9937039.1 sulfatase-like hydrolase/transferase [Planctomycetaceae bacterium]